VQCCWSTQAHALNVQLSKCYYHTYRHMFNFTGISHLILWTSNSHHHHWLYAAFVLKLFTPQILLQKTMAAACPWVIEKECLWIYLSDYTTGPEKKPKNSDYLVQWSGRHLLSHNINATSPANTQRLTRTFSAVQQYCLTLKMQATRPFETSGTASHPTRTEQSATPLTEPEITQK